jgi:hypothetical protein
MTGSAVMNIVLDALAVGTFLLYLSPHTFIYRAIIPQHSFHDMESMGTQLLGSRVSLAAFFFAAG